MFPQLFFYDQKRNAGRRPHSNSRQRSNNNNGISILITITKPEDNNKNNNHKKNHTDEEIFRLPSIVRQVPIIFSRFIWVTDDKKKK